MNVNETHEYRWNAGCWDAGWYEVSRYVSPCHVAVCLTSIDQTFQTVQGNLESMKNTFNLAAMPKTFQDAIELTRSLSIKYLWIDSLRMRDEAKFPKKKSPENHFACTWDSTAMYTNGCAMIMTFHFQFHRFNLRPDLISLTPHRCVSRVQSWRRLWARVLCWEVSLGYTSHPSPFRLCPAAVDPGPSATCKDRHSSCSCTRHNWLGSEGAAFRC